ncbi:MAG: signal peptidase I [Clostridia bacterium]|nr:signal peptidase I [Clostridia bacterium]
MNDLSKGFEIDTDFVENEPPEKTTIKKEIIDGLSAVASALIIVVILFGFIFRIAVISGDSMKNTLFDKEIVIISNLNYTPKYGDIVVISRNAENTPESAQKDNGPIIKRVIATENQEVDIDFEKGIVYVDKVALVEDYISTPTHRQDDIEFPVTVPKGCVFVLGDNREVSLDSRDSRIGKNGMVDTRYILGEAVLRVFPFNKFGGLKLNG